MDNLYRVRKSWADVSSQIGAYAILDNAKAAVDSNPGYAAYDSNGSQVYPILYRVRKSWNDASSQKGAFTVLENAKKCADSCAPGDGYAVFNTDGICVYPLPYYVMVASNTNYYTAADGKTKAGIATKNKYTIIEASGKYGKLKSGAGWLPLTGLSVTPAIDPGELVIRRAKVIGDYMVKNKFHYGVYGNEGTPTSFSQAVSKKWLNSSCTRYASWVFQAAGYLKEGKCISHTLGNKSSLIDCEIIKVNKVASDLIASKTVKAGDMLISSSTTCGNNYGSIFAGYNDAATKKYWYEAGGPFKGVNTSKTAPYTYSIIGPWYCPYDYTHTIEYIIRPTGSGDGGIDLSEIII